MKPEHGKIFSTASDTFGVKSRAALAQFTPNEIRHHIQETGQECGWSEALALHAEAKKEYDSLRIMEKSLLTRASPLLPAAVRMGLKHPDVSLQDYEEWFGRETRFAGPGEVASMFSPAAYLTELYRYARKLYPEDSHWHIDNRRPDLSGLLLRQENMDKEVTALSLSNEILMEKMRSELDSDSEDERTSSNDDVMKVLAENLTSSTTPFHLHHARLRQVRLQKDPSYGQMLAAPRVTGQFSGPTLAGIHYDIPPALYKLLTDEINEKNAKTKFKEYFGESVDPVLILDPKTLRRWYGLTTDELKQINSNILTLNSYSFDTLNTVIEGNIYRIRLTGFNNNNTIRVYPISDKSMKIEGVTKFSGNQGYALCPGYTGTNPTIRWKNDRIRYNHNEPFSITINMKDAEHADDNATFRLSGEDSLRVGKWWPNASDGLDGEFHRVTWNITPLGSVYVYALRLNKAIRLYKATGLPPRVLEDIVNSVNPTQINDDTLTLLFRTPLLMKHYGVSHEEALVMSRGNISQVTHGAESSQWDRVFNTPPLIEGGFYPDDKAINLLPEDPNDTDIKATLKRAFCTDDDGLWTFLQIYDSSAAGHELQLNLNNISGMYGISLWARALSLSPQELIQLLKMLGLPSKVRDEPVQQWNALFIRASIAVEWLRTRGWVVGDMMLMTRDVAHIPPGSEIAGLLTSLRTAAVTASLPEKPGFNNYALALIPSLAASLNLPGEDLTHALLAWADGAVPGGGALAEFWTRLVKEKPDQDDTSALTAFAYGLAQMALIVHATGVTAEALKLFVSNPARLLATADATLARSAEVVMALGQFSEWLRTLPDLSGAGSAVVKGLAADGVTQVVLAQATGLSSTIVEQAVTEAKDRKGKVDDTKLVSWQEISLVLEWIKLAQAFGVMPSDIGRLMKLDYLASTTPVWDDWKQVADAFTAALPAVQRRAAEDNVAVGLSGALSGWLLVESSLTRLELSSREELFNFLLSDNLNGPQVKTSRIAEAITSLQIFIHRVLSLTPSDPESLEVNQNALNDLFFRDWLQWNARFSTWAGGQKLMYYPENYIDPTMRLGQTSMMDDMLQVLGQAQINTDTVGDAFMGYLTGFEEVANLETISAFHDSSNPDVGKTWLVGRNQMTPPEYWWRSLDEGKRSNEGELPANAWTGWSKITAAPQPSGNLIRPVVYKERLYLGWVERKKEAATRNNEGQEIAWQYSWELKMSWLRYDGGWSQPVAYIYPDTAGLEDLLEDSAIEDLSLYLSFWPEKQQMVAGIYTKRFGSEVTESDFKGHIVINEDMTFEPFSFFEGGWNNFKLVLDTNSLSKVLPPFIHVADEVEPLHLFVEQELTGPSVVPEGFRRFDYSDLKVSVIEENPTEKTYKLKMGLTQIVDLDPSLLADRALLKLLDIYSELKSVNTTCKAIHSTLAPNGLDGLWARDMGDYVQFYIIFRTRRITDPWTHIESREYALSTATVDGVTYQYGSYASWDVEFSDISPANLNFHMFTNLANLKLSFATLLGSTSFRTSDIFPAQYTDRPVIIPMDQVKSNITIEGNSTTYTGYTASRNLDLEKGTDEYLWREASYPSSSAKFEFNGKEIIHKVELTCGNGKKRTWKLRVYKAAQTRALTVDVIGGKVTDGQRAQYLQHGEKRTRLNTLFARQLTEKAASGIDTILNYSTQSLLSEPPIYEDGNWSAMDFSGANAIYFWELFYYTPMMIMQRFLQEESFDLAEKWLKYIFSPSGYIVHGEHDDRMWNVRPLSEDTSWNDEPLKVYDPDAIAQNDPMHYKLNAFMRLLDITIGKGDAAYRKMERDTLAEAKVWYGRALTLLGEDPWIEADPVWKELDLGSVAANMVLSERIDALSQIAQGIRHSGDIAQAAGITTFLPEVNEVMLGYWKTLRIRLYNLRHNLTIDGQPLNLPLFATPADPKTLLAAAVAAESGPDSELPIIFDIPALRFTPLLESARSMASQLIQFGSSMQQILLSQDAEALAELLNTQGASLAASSITLQEQTLLELAAERGTLEKSIEAVKTRRDHYKRLYQENVNAREIHSINLLTTSETMGAAIKPLYVAAAAAGIAPNIFGMANGGMKYEGPLNAIGTGLEIAASGMHIAGSRIQQEEMYRRRREEWDIQYRSAEKEIQGLEAQLTALGVRETSARMQIAYVKTQSQHATALLEQFQNKFTSKAMYSWLRGRLATIYYQYYDLTASLCLMAQKALQWEKGDTNSYLNTGTWSGAWAGLMAGEGLMLSLAQMEMAWMKHQKRELEVTRTVSLKAFFDEKLGEDSFTSGISKLLNGKTGSLGEGNNRLVYETNGGQLAIHFSLKDLNVAPDYSDSKTLRVRSISVTLPALLGPYQNVKARLRTDSTGLPAGCNECAISQAMHDNGLFTNDGSGDPRWGARWLPFEGLCLRNESGMTLSFAEAAGDQKSLLESLSDVILHIQFTVR